MTGNIRIQIGRDAAPRQVVFFALRKTRRRAQRQAPEQNILTPAIHTLLKTQGAFLPLPGERVSVKRIIVRAFGCPGIRYSCHLTQPRQEKAPDLFKLNSTLNLLN
jgi:hypothetical protein